MHQVGVLVGVLRLGVLVVLGRFAEVLELLGIVGRRIALVVAVQQPVLALEDAQHAEVGTALEELLVVAAGAEIQQVHR